jgi:hypothetical protein
MLPPCNKAQQTKQLGQIMLDPDIVAAILNDIAGDGLSLRKAAAKYQTSGQSFLRVCDADKNVAEQYARACATRGHLLIEEGLALVDSCVGQPSEVVQAVKLQWDARRWYASKLDSKRLGDKVIQEVTGADGGPLQVTMPPLDAIRDRIKKA